MKKAQISSYRRNKRKNNTNPKTTVDSTDDPSVKLANRMWEDLKTKIKTDPSFVDLSDSEKVEIYQKTEFKDFYNTHPIVSRYLVCMGQYSSSAFKKYLKKIEMNKPKMRFMNKESKMELYIENQAFYVKQLWIAYQRQHYSQKDAADIYKHALDTLKQEFLDIKPF